MKSNIFLITIDSLRVDRISSMTKSSFTPNIDKLIKNGTFFLKTISTSDATGTSIGSIFSGCFPFQTGINHFNYNEKIPMFSDILKENNYFLSSTTPDVSFFLKLNSNFDKNFSYVYDKRENWLQLDGGIGDKIVDELNSLKGKMPWFYYVHLMDLHSPFKLPLKFQSTKFGLTSYDQMISYIDVWLGRFFEQINFEETIVILSADHGDYIPIHDMEFNYNDNFQKFLRKGKKIFPQLEPLGVKLFEKTKLKVRNQKLNKMKNQLSEKDFRTLGMRGDASLFDELLLTPLIMSGKKIPKSKSINAMVRQVDIFPTILDLIDVEISIKTLHGRSLFALIQDEKIEELPAYIETGTRNPKKLGKLIGIRTSKYKFLRTRTLDETNFTLFDLQNDPDEENNIANNNPEICTKMNELLSTLKKESTPLSKKELSTSEEREIEEELKKLGYM